MRQAKSTTSSTTLIRDGKCSLQTYLCCADKRRYWLSSMTPDDLLLMKMYDTGAGTQANCKLFLMSSNQHTITNSVILTVCPHVSVENPNASSDASPRHSVETRSVVIS